MSKTRKKDAKGKSEAPRTIFCPKCGSPDIFWASGLAQLWSIWQCRDCGYRGAFIIEDGKLAERIRADHTRKIPEPESPKPTPK